MLHKNLTLSTIRLEDAAQSDARVKKHLAQYPQARGYLLNLDVEMPGWQGKGLGQRVSQNVSYSDAQGILTWGATPQTAPVLHLRGPWSLVPSDPFPRLTVGWRADFVCSLGTPGVGPGSTAYVGYEGVVPEQLHPTLEITYPPARPGEPPLKQLYELKERC